MEQPSSNVTRKKELTINSNLHPVNNIETTSKDPKLWRDLTAFWLIGICTAYGFHIMLVSANDLLSDDYYLEKAPQNLNVTDLKDTARHCNPLPTGVILLANIIPALFIKLILPFTPALFNMKIFMANVFTVGGYITVAYAKTKPLVLFGVGLMSLSMGIGESTMIGLTTFYHKNTIFAWSSGTGGAAIFSSLIYTGLKELKLSTRSVLLIQLVIPIIEILSFWIVLSPPQGFRRKGLKFQPVHYGTSTQIPIVVLSHDSLQEGHSSHDDENRFVVPSFFALPTVEYHNKPMNKRVSMKDHLKDEVHYIPSIGKYIIPLFANYFFNYFTNQGLFEHIFFPGLVLDRPAQYRYFQATYTIGVFISKSISHLARFKHVWITSLIMFCLTVCMFSEAIFYYTSSIYIVFGVILTQGLLGGSGFVNTFYRITDEVEEEKRMFAMGLTDFADTPALTLVGFLTIPVHDFICGLPLPDRLK